MTNNGVDNPDGGSKNKTPPKKGSSRRSSKPRPMLLRVLMDTNQLYTGSASDLLRGSVRKLILDSRSHGDVRIEWIIPQIVRWEREYQMRSAAEQFLPTLQKLERLLGHGLAISEDILSLRVKENVERQIEELGISVVALDSAVVDWTKMTQASAFREPPFEKGNGEKGFRDALIAECFLQIIAGSPKSAGTCRVAVVTNDGLLAQVMEIATSGNSNVRVLRSIDDLQSLINTLVSHVTEEFVAKLRSLAQTLFFSPDSDEGFLQREGIMEKIRQTYDARLKEIPKSAVVRENGTWYIGAPSFVEKRGQRITWRTSIEVEATAFKLQAPSEALSSGLTAQPTSLLGLLGSGSAATGLGLGLGLGLPASGSGPPPSGLALGGPSSELGRGNRSGLASIALASQKVPVATGRCIFHVTWSVTVTSTGKLTHFKLIGIDWKETNWQ